MKIDILFEDAHMLVVNKPAGVLVIPDRFEADIPCLKQILEKKQGARMFVVHRLDRETSGVICFAKNEDAHKHLSLQFQQHEAEKYYTGLVNGHVYPEFRRIEAAIGPHPAGDGRMIVVRKGKPSVTEYQVQQQWPLYSLLGFRIFTGRTHQIRVHIQHAGHSIVCDRLYGDGKPFYLSDIKRKYRLSEKDEEERPLLQRLALHASRLVVRGIGDETVDVSAPLPKDITACVRQLDKWTTGSNRD